MDKDRLIMVTGAHGLVGSAFVELLKVNGYTNIISVGRNECDLVNQKQSIEFIQDHKPDYIFHSAARVYGIMGNMGNKALSFYDNAMINVNVVHGAHLARSKKITVMGTGCIYPYPSPSLPLQENMIFNGRPHQSEDSYAQAKRAMLAMCEAYKESNNLDWAYVISCNLFGPNDKFDTELGHVVPSLIKKFYDAKKNGGVVSIWGDGSAQRDFLYVKDAARAALMIMESVDGACNMGSGSVYSIKQIVDMIAKITGMEHALSWDKSKPNGQDYRSYDLSRLKATGFSPKWTIEEGLRETWKWYCDQM